MRKVTLLPLILAATTCASVLSAEMIPAGSIAWDVTIPGTAGEFDIVNQTGPNASIFPDTTFPISTTLNLSSLSLIVDFSDGSTTTFGPSYFTASLDGISFDGGVIPIGGASPLPIDATLTGDFSTTSITLNDGSTETILPSFSATILASSPPDLSDGDMAIIYATTPRGGVVPEPATVSWMLLGLFFVGLVIRKQAHRFAGFKRLLSGGTGWLFQVAFAVICLTSLAAQSQAQVHLNVATAPSSGVAGVTFVNATGSSFPPGHGTFPAANITVSLALSCFAPSPTTATANSVTHVLGTSYRVHFELPPSLSTALYFAWINGTTSDGTTFASSDCSQVQVTHTNAALAACVPTSSLGIIAPAKGPAAVQAVVPNGAWAAGRTGIRVVQLETGGGPVVPPLPIDTNPITSALVNSCAGNPATGESVCVANDNTVFHLSPTDTVTVLHSASNQFSGFSGGSCENCGVAINALTNQAVIAMGLSTSPSGAALQTLNLSNDTFLTPFSTHNQISEDISIDPNRGYILNPAEFSGIYGIDQFNTQTGVINSEFSDTVTPFLVMDSAGEDCSTGIALTVGEGSDNIFLADLTQATFTAGTPGTWHAPQQVQTIIGSYSAGLDGIAVAQGTSHLATVTGEFGGSSFSVLLLPATSGTGTPAIVDYAYVQCVTGMSAGFDPHTVSAYTSPNNGKAYTVFANWFTGVPDSLLVADMAAILAAPRQGDGHTVIGDDAGKVCLTPGDGLVSMISTL